MTETFTEDEAAQRLELRVDDELVGFIGYRTEGSSRVLAHTEVFEGHEGEGLGSRLVAEFFDRADSAGMSVRPTCPFAAKWVQRHPDQLPRVEAGMQAQLS